LPEDAWPTQVTESEAKNVELEFDKGELVGLNGVKYDHPTKVIQELQAIAGPYGLGRDIHVGDTIIGIKAALVLRLQHR
jgi:argininosuccinate synthase